MADTTNRAPRIARYSLTASLPAQGRIDPLYVSAGRRAPPGGGAGRVGTRRGIGLYAVGQRSSFPVGPRSQDAGGRAARPSPDASGSRSKASHSMKVG